MKESLYLNDLFKNINTLRRQLILLGKNKGLTNPDTIKCSTELDELILTFQKHKLLHTAKHYSST